MNQVHDILQIAERNQWCTSLHCTTCGSTEFRGALKALSDADPRRYVRDLATVLHGTAVQDEDGLFLALGFLETEQDMDEVLRSWIPMLREHIRLADLVLFYYLRRGAFFARMSIDVAAAWRASCIDIAVRTRNESLVESLICTMGREYKDNSSLTATVEELAPSSRRVAKALRRIGA